MLVFFLKKSLYFHHVHYVFLACFIHITANLSNKSWNSSNYNLALLRTSLLLKCQKSLRKMRHENNGVNIGPEFRANSVDPDQTAPKGAV